MVNVIVDTQLLARFLLTFLDSLHRVESLLKIYCLTHRLLWAILLTCRCVSSELAVFVKRLVYCNRFIAKTWGFVVFAQFKPVELHCSLIGRMMNQSGASRLLS